MIRINLLPFRATRKTENTRRQISIFFLSLILAICALVLLHNRLGSQVDELTLAVEDTKAEVLKYQKINFEIAGIKRELKVLNNKIEVIETLESNRAGPVRLLDAMTGIVIQKRMWFTSLQEKVTSETPETTTTVITINGLAEDNKTVADFMERLEGSKLFSSVNLMTLRKEEKGDALNLKRFQINCNKMPPETATSAGKADKK